jgi:ribosomal 50S subunit-associated protein YjgA (DUF615 family)
MDVLARAKELFVSIESEIANVINLQADYKDEIESQPCEEDILDEFIFSEKTELQQDLVELEDIHQKLVELRNKVTRCLIS